MIKSIYNNLIFEDEIENIEFHSTAVSFKKHISWNKRICTGIIYHLKNSKDKCYSYEVLNKLL